MKVITPSSYQKIFAITPGAAIVSPNRGLLLQITNATNSIALTFVDDTTVTLSNLAVQPTTGTATLILPISVKKVTAATAITVYGLL